VNLGRFGWFPAPGTVDTGVANASEDADEEEGDEEEDEEEE